MRVREGVRLTDWGGGIILLAEEGYEHPSPVKEPCSCLGNGEGKPEYSSSVRVWS